MEASTVICDDDCEVYENLSRKLLKDSKLLERFAKKFSFKLKISHFLDIFVI